MADYSRTVWADNLDRLVNDRLLGGLRRVFGLEASRYTDGIRTDNGLFYAACDEIADRYRKDRAMARDESLPPVLAAALRACDPAMTRAQVSNVVKRVAYDAVTAELGRGGPL